MARAGDVLDNPATGERIVFRQTAAETDSAVLDYGTTQGHVQGLAPDASSRAVASSATVHGDAASLLAWACPQPR